MNTEQTSKNIFMYIVTVYSTVVASVPKLSIKQLLQLSQKLFFRQLLQLLEKLSI